MVVPSAALRAVRACRLLRLLPAQHATGHFRETGHPLVQSYEPGEGWYWNFATNELFEAGPELAPPASHPADQPTPGPAGRVPDDWARGLRQ